MASKHPSTVTFPVQDFKRLETPLDHLGYRDFLCVVDVLDLPDLSEMGRSNLRDPKDKGRVPEQIRQSLLEEDLFVYLNRGLVIVAADVKFDNKSKIVKITFTQPDVHGLIDGGHTHLIISKEKEALRSKEEEGGVPVLRHVKVEILKGFDLEQTKDIAGARNTSNQVRDESLLNLEGRFEPLQGALNGQPYAGDIAYKEYETYSDDSAKPIDVRDIISILYMFDIDTFTSAKHPINGYRSKVACLKEFKTKTDGRGPTVYEKIYPILPDILRLHDEIHLALPELYNRARKQFGEDVTGGKFGRLTGVTHREKSPVQLPFTRAKTKYRIPAGFVYPILGAFRALLEERDGSYCWVNGCDPSQLLDSDMGLQMADGVGGTARRDANPSKTGKDASLWQSCYQAAVIARQNVEIAELKARHHRERSS